MAGTYLDHRLPRRMVPQLAEKLYTLMNQAGWIAMQRISDNPVGDITDHKDLNVEVIGTIRLKGSEEEILLRRLKADHGEGYTWKFDHDFLQKIPALYTAIEEQSLKRYFPAWSHDSDVFGVRLWQWFMLISALIGTIFLALLITSLFYRSLVHLNNKYHNKIDATVLRDSFRPMKYLFMISVFHFVTLFLEIPLAARSLIYSVETLLAVVIVASVGIKASNLFISYLRGVLEKSQRSNALAMLPPARKAMKIMIVSIAITYFLTRIGVNITAIFAGLGIGGIAIALAGQKTIENLIGGISIIIDQPVRVGDYCRFGDNKEGKVEDIGLRSTRIRTLDRTLVSIPNAEFAQTQIENFGKRDMIRLYQVIGVPCDTSAAELRYLLLKIKDLLLVHPRIAGDPLRVRFINFGVSSLDIEVFAYPLS
jgi:MscS family membrane protein